MLRLRLCHSPRENALRSSHTQIAAARAVAEHRDAMVTEWADWLSKRSASRAVPRQLLERQLCLVVDGMVAMLGPLRREAKVVWQHLMEHYGQVGVTRGLAAGEVVEELQQLRTLLIDHVGALVAAMRPRRAVAMFLRLNGIVDRGIALAVVGYTDALVASLMMTDRPTPSALETGGGDDVARQLDAIEAELGTIASRR